MFFVARNRSTSTSIQAHTHTQRLDREGGSEFQMLQRAGKETTRRERIGLNSSTRAVSAHAPHQQHSSSPRADGPRRQAHAWPIPLYSRIGPSSDWIAYVDDDARIEFPRQPPRCVICDPHEFTTLALNSLLRSVAPQSGSFCSRYLYPRAACTAHLPHLAVPSTEALKHTTTTPQHSSRSSRGGGASKRASADRAGAEDDRESSPRELRARRVGRAGIRRRRRVQGQPRGEGEPARYMHASS